MVLRSGAAIQPSERNQHRQSQHQKQRISGRPLSVANDDEEEEPLVRKRHRIVDSSQSASHPISATVEEPPATHPISTAVEEPPATHPISTAVEEPPATHSISAAVEHCSMPAVITLSIPQETMMSKFKLPPPNRSAEQRMSQSPVPYFRQQPIPLVQQDQPASFSSSQTSHTPVYPLQPDMSPKALASLPFPLQSAPSRSTPNDPRRRFASEEQEFTTGYWRSAENRALKDWITTGDNYARTRDVQLAKMSGGVSGVYREAAAFVREKLPHLSESEFSDKLARKRVEYMAKKVREVIRKTTSTGSGTRDGITLYEQRETLFPGFNELWEVMKHDKRFKETPTLESVVDHAPEREEIEGIYHNYSVGLKYQVCCNIIIKFKFTTTFVELQIDIWDDAELAEDYGTFDGAESIASGGRSSKASKQDIAAGIDTLIDTVSSTLGTHDISSYFQTRIRELEDKCDKWQEKYEKLKDEYWELRVRCEVLMQSNIKS